MIVEATNGAGLKSAKVSRPVAVVGTGEILLDI